MKKRDYIAIGERVYSEKLPNGLTVLVDRKAGFNKKYAFFAARYGGADRRFKLSGQWVDTPAGIAHFLEHKMFDMKDYNALALLSSNGASPNAFTSSGMTAYHFECTDKFFDNLRILLDFVSTPYFTEESVKKEQGIIGQEIRMTEDDPDFALYYEFLKCLYAHNPVRDSVAGTVESISEITAETLYDCHRVFYDPSNMVLCVAGDVDPQAVADMAERILPKTPGPVPERDYGPEEGMTPVKAYSEKEMDVGMPMFAFGTNVRAEARGKSFHRQSLTAELALKLLVGRSSRLYSEMYASGLINSKFSAAYETTAGAAYTLFSGEGREAERVRDMVGAEAEKIVRNGADTALFERIKRAEAGRTIRGLNSFDNLCYNMADGHFMGYDALEAYELLRGITAEDAVKFIGESLKSENIALASVKKQQ